MKTTFLATLSLVVLLSSSCGEEEPKAKASISYNAQNGGCGYLIDLAAGGATVEPERFKATYANELPQNVLEEVRRNGLASITYETYNAQGGAITCIDGTTGYQHVILNGVALNAQ